MKKDEQVINNLMKMSPKNLKAIENKAASFDLAITSLLGSNKWCILWYDDKAAGLNYRERPMPMEQFALMTQFMQKRMNDHLSPRPNHG